MSKNGGIIGISDHGGWAVLVTVARDGTLLDRRRVELVDENLPSLPHHHEGQLLPMDGAVALRSCPQLPATIAERIKDYRARNVADWVMYRKALASAAQARGWPMHWYDAKTVLGAASQALHVEDFDAHFLQARRAVGPPWNKDHKLALAAAIVTAAALSETPDRGAC